MASREADKRSELLTQSQQAYKEGDGEQAKILSNKAKEHEAKMDEYNEKAASFVFQANNVKSAADEIDLHGLFVDEAIDVLGKRIQACIERRDSYLKAIVGKGLHSEHGPKIKYAVEEMCQKQGFRWALEEGNSGVIVIDFTQSGGEVPVDQIRPPQKSHGSAAEYYQQGQHGQTQYGHGQYGGSQNGPPSYGQQQQQHQQQSGSGLLKILCGLFRIFTKEATSSR